MEQDVNTNHGQVDNVENDDNIRVIKDFMQNTRKVTKPDNQQKGKAFALNWMGNDRFVDGKRPGNAETEKHNNFKNAHLINHLAFRVLCV